MNSSYYDKRSPRQALAVRTALAAPSCGPSMHSTYESPELHTVVVTLINQAHLQELLLEYQYSQVG